MIKNKSFEETDIKGLVFQRTEDFIFIIRFNQLRNATILLKWQIMC